MVIYEYPFDTKQNIDKCVLALGFFDGVHLAHRDLLESARSIAEERGLKFGIFSFKSSGEIKNATKRLYNDEEKAEIFENMGADLVVFADFLKIAHLSAEKFVKDVLISDLNSSVCVAGFNFRFGNHASGDANDLIRLMEDGGGEAVICEEITSGDGTTLSSTLIRDMLTKGKIKEATEYLGAPYYIKGIVSQGRQVGRVLGFPTVNIPISDEKTVPRLGVYRTAIPIDGKIYSAVTNIGVCPTFESRDIHIESFILDFDGDLYGKDLKVFLLDFIRDEKSFSSPEELKMQINIDKNIVIKENGDIKWQDLGLKLQ